MKSKIILGLFFLTTSAVSIFQHQSASANINFCRSICDPDMGASCGRIGPSRIYCYNSMAECQASCPAAY